MLYNWNVAKCIATLTLGKKYEDYFNKYSRKGWEEYSHKYKMDLKVINIPLDISLRASKRSPAWQKLLILSQPWSKQYEQIVWIDSDIVINVNTSPDIFSFCEVNRVGAVNSWDFPTQYMYRRMLLEQYSRFEVLGRKIMKNIDPFDYYLNRGIKPDAIDVPVLQTGVVVCAPEHHRELFEHIYYNYEDSFGPEGNYEMPAMSFEIVKNNFWTPIPNEFNLVVRDFLAIFYPQELHSKRLLAQKMKSLKNRYLGDPRLARIFQLGWFIHFAGYQYKLHHLKNS